MTEKTIDQTLNAIFERVPSIRAAFDDDVRNRRNAVTAERAAVIDEFQGAEQEARRFDNQIDKAKTAVEEAKVALDKANRNLSEISREQSALLFKASAARKRLHLEFGNADITAAIYRVQNFQRQCKAMLANIETYIAELRKSADPFRRDDIARLQDRIESLQKEIAWIDSAGRELKKLELSVMHPDDLRAEVARQLVSVFGIEKPADHANQPDV